VAATVNGQPIPEAAVQRGLERVPPDKRAQARPELLNYLIDNVLIDQHLRQLQVTVDNAEVDKRVADMRAELQKEKKDFEQMLKTLRLTEAELREHITADLRWEKYVTSQATDKVLRELFDANKEMFDGSQVRARHILLTPPAGDAKAGAAAAAQLAGYKKQVEAQVAEGLAKLPANSDNLARAKARATLTDEAFAALAKEKSECPSKAQGGDVGWFRRAGFMVEPFSKAAFALKPNQMSDVVQTPFGYHLILVTERKPGAEVKFEDAKEMAREIYADRLRDGLAAQTRQKARIDITPVAKP
jgi:peptidyl-prolyl cis-trans isomerase C